MIRNCDKGHTSLDAANWRCPWCEIEQLREQVTIHLGAAFKAEAERDALRETVDAIRAKIGHFAGKPIIDDMPLLSLLIEVADLVEARKP